MAPQVKPDTTYDREHESDLTLSFELDLGLEVRSIAPDRRDRQRPIAALEAHRRVARVERSVHSHRVPALRVSDVTDRHVVVLAPEERHRIEALAPPQHVPRGGLTLTLGDHPVLDAD